MFYSQQVLKTSTKNLGGFINEHVVFLSYTKNVFRLIFKRNKERQAGMMFATLETPLGWILMKLEK